MQESCQVEAWAGRVPICFELAIDEVAGECAPRAFYAMVPRSSYLPTLACEITAHFEDSTPQLSYGLTHRDVKVVEEENQVDEDSERRKFVPLWFSDRELAMRWQYPVGVLYDLVGKRRLPWTLTVHFSKFPQHILDLRNSDTCERTFFHSFKQAVHLETGTSRSALNMPRVHQTEMWKAIVAGDREAYLVRDILPSRSLEAPPKSVPVRVMRGGHDKPFVQVPRPPYDDDGRKRTVRETLMVDDEEDGNITLRAQGVTLDPELALIDAWKALRSADHFLYVLVSPAARQYYSSSRNQSLVTPPTPRGGGGGGAKEDDERNDEN